MIKTRISSTFETSRVVVNVFNIQQTNKQSINQKTKNMKQTNIQKETENWFGTLYGHQNI